MKLSDLALIGVPSSAGARQTGQEKAPAAFREAGLPDRLRSRGLDVADLGDLAVVPFRPDGGHPRQQNVPLVIEVARQAAERVDRAVADRRMPVVLGGDCSLTLGVISGLLRHRARLGLIYFDGDVDLNTPATTRSGAFDGMVLAHILGLGVEEVAGLGSRRPLLDEEDIVLFGYDPESGWVDEPEIEILKRLRTRRHPLDRVRENPAREAGAALATLGSRVESFLVHFDVDVMNIAAVDVPHPRGLDPGATFAALRAFVTSPGCAGLVVTELNPMQDPDRSDTAIVAGGLVEALGARIGIGS